MGVVGGGALERQIAHRSLKNGVFTSRDPAVEHTIPLQDLGEPCRGIELSERFPNLGNFFDCVLIRTVRGAQRFICRFPTAEDAEQFFTCMSILRLSATVGRVRGDAPVGTREPLDAHDPFEMPTTQGERAPC